MSQPIRATDVRAEKVEFLWGDRIPKGMITVVAGRPDQGKGLFAAHVAAQVSQTGRVLYSAAEDSAGLMTRPRLEAAGANLDNVLLWRFRMPANLSELQDLIISEKIDLVVMDPFASHLSGGINRHGDNVRTVLQPLTETIESTGTAVLIIEHALKRIPQSGDPLQAIGGSGSGLPAAARAAYVFGVDPDDEDRRILAKAKFNVGSPPKALAFEIDVEDVDPVGAVPFLEVEEELMAFDPMRLFTKPSGNGKVGRPPDKRAAAAEWLTNYLVNVGAPVHSGKIQEDAKQYGMSVKTLRRAAGDMGIVKNPAGGGRNCTWDLPNDVKDLMGLETGYELPTGPTEETPVVDGDAMDAALAQLLTDANEGDVTNE